MSTTIPGTVTITGNASLNGVAQANVPITTTRTLQGGLPVTLPVQTTDTSGNWGLVDPGLATGVYVYEATTPTVPGSYNGGDTGPQTVDITIPTIVLVMTVTVTPGSSTVTATATTPAPNPAKA